MISTALKWMESIARHGRVSAWAPQSIRDVSRRTTQMMLDRHNARTLQAFISGRKANLEDIASFVRTRATPLNAPMILISQVQRSGGSLLNQLFDAHPQLACYPGELRFGGVDPDSWSILDTSISADGNFRAMFDLKLGRMVGRGYIKGGGKRLADQENLLVDRGVQRHRFLSIPHVQYTIFKELFENSPPSDQRGIFDRYFTAFFNGWLDYQGQLDEKKKWITAFAPRLVQEEANMAAFFDAYPDGRLVQIVRDPMTWYPSAQRHRRTFRRGTTPQELLESWCISAKSILRNKERYGDSVVVLSFEDLVGRTEPTMRHLAREFAIAYDPVLLRPTFNSRAIGANSSFAVEGAGVIKAPLARKKLLSPEDRRNIEKQCLGLYERVSALARRIRPQRSGT